MRLGQLARKLAIRPSQIVDYLSTQQIYLEEGSNAKLYDEHVDRIVQQFAPGLLTEIEAEIRTEEAEEKITTPIGLTESVTDSENLKTENSESEPDLKLEKPELIKATKLELSGLKVLGKIELLEPKKKEKPVTDSVAEDTKAETQERGRQQSNRRQIPDKPKKEVQQPWRNPIALQREREARESEEKKKEAAEREKERRKEHYLKRVNVGQPTKPARIFDEPVEPYIPQKSNKRSLSLWGRFMQWLNG